MKSRAFQIANFPAVGKLKGILRPYNPGVRHNALPW